MRAASDTPERTLRASARRVASTVVLKRMRFMPSLCHARTGTAENGNARLATDDIATEVARLCDEPGDGVVSIGGAGERLISATWTGLHCPIADLIDNPGRVVVRQVVPGRRVSSDRRTQLSGYFVRAPVRHQPIVRGGEDKQRCGDVRR